MTCSEAAASHDDVVDGRLPLERRQAFANHVHECSTCNQTLKHVRCVRRLLRRLPRERMPDPMKNSLLEELRRSRSISSPARPAPHSHSPLVPHPHQTGPKDTLRSTSRSH